MVVSGQVNFILLEQQHLNIVKKGKTWITLLRGFLMESDQRTSEYQQLLLWQTLLVHVLYNWPTSNIT